MEKRLNWATLDDEEKAAYLGYHVLQSQQSVLDYDLIQKCLTRLDIPTRDLFITNMLSEVASDTYSGMTQSQIESESTMRLFHFNMVAADLELLGRCLYWAIRGEGI